jgi:hypothetical protein
MSSSEVEDKFRGCTRAVLSKAQQSDIIALVQHLESLASINELMSALAVGDE